MEAAVCPVFEFAMDVVRSMMGSRQPLVGQLRKDASGWDQDGVRGYEVKAGSKVTGIPAGKKLCPGP